MGMVAYSPLARYYSTGGTPPGPLAYSSRLPDVEQDLALTAPASGYYLLVVANLGNWTAAPFTLSVIVNGERWRREFVGHGDVTASNRENFYRFSAGPRRGPWPEPRSRQPRAHGLAAHSLRARPQFD